MSEEEKIPSFFSQSAPLLFLVVIFFLNFMARIILAPLMPVVEKDLGIGHGEAGALFLLISIGYFMALLGSGLISSRLTHRKTIILSAAALGLAVISVSFGQSLWNIRLGLLIVGLASGIYLPSGIATLTTMVTPKDWGKAVAIHELAPNLSFVAAPLLSEMLLGWVSWRGVLTLLGIASVLSGTAFVRFGRGGEFKGDVPSVSSFRAILRMPALWIMIGLFSLGIGASFGIYTMLPLYLVSERGMDLNWANTLVGLSRIGGVGMSFLAGWVTDRIGPRGALKGVFLLTGIMTVLLGAAPDALMVAVIFIQPAVAVCFFPAGFSALSRISPPGLRNIAVSLTIPIAFLLGAGAIPIWIGTLGDVGLFSLAIALVGGVIIAGSIAAHYLKFPEANQYL